MVQILFTYRSQFVSINGFNSDFKTIKYGVPQGSVLGLLLFLIFINDLITAIESILRLFILQMILVF